MEDEDQSFPYFDVWPLGIIAYEMMSGKIPYSAKAVHMEREIRNKERPHIEGYSQRLNNLVDRMLAIDGKDRITIDELLQELGNADHRVQKVLQVYN